MVARMAGKIGIKFNIYYAFLFVINLFTLLLCFWDVKGIVLFAFTLGFSMYIRILLTQREEQRLTNELLEELIERTK